MSTLGSSYDLTKLPKETPPRFAHHINFNKKLFDWWSQSTAPRYQFGRFLKAQVPKKKQQQKNPQNNLLLEDNDVPVHELVQGLVQRDIIVLYPLC